MEFFSPISVIWGGPRAEERGGIQWANREGGVFLLDPLLFIIIPPPPPHSLLVLFAKGLASPGGLQSLVAVGRAQPGEMG